MKTPRRIFLQPDMGDGEGRTWAGNRVTPDDVEYVRADQVARLKKHPKPKGKPKP
jgi:hypothetical protein